jgi:benzylsuccinate CoA-transferase BbsF subunit
LQVRQALKGVKILEFGRVVTGPVASEMLAFYGATVVKIETMQNIDALRSTPPYKDNISGVNRSSYFTKYNVNKLGIGLNLNKTRGLELFNKLVTWCDVLLECNGPGVAAKFGVTYKKLKEINPHIIMIHTSQFGQQGPLSKFKSYGAQSTALAGFYHFTTYPDGTITTPFGAYTDLISYQLVALAIMGALHYRENTGKGSYIDHSQVEAGVMFLTPAVVELSANKKLSPSDGNQNHSASPHGFYQCQGDDRWCSISIFNDEQWNNFCRVTGHVEWINDQRFNTPMARKRNCQELDRLISEWTRSNTAEYVMYELQAGGVPAGLVSRNVDVFMDSQLRARDYFVELDHPEIGYHTHERPPHIFSETPARFVTSGPCLGEHNEKVCKEILGLTDDEISDLVIEGTLERS